MGAATMIQRLADNALSGPHANVGFQLAFDAHLSGALDEAVVGYRGVVADVPAHVDAWANLSIALQALGRAEEAAAAGRRALALRPDMAELYVNLVAALKSLGKLGEALDALERAIALQPGSALISAMCCAPPAPRRRRSTPMNMPPCLRPAISPPILTKAWR